MNLATLWGVLGAIGIAGALSAWIGGYIGGFLPPLPRLVRAILNTGRCWRRRFAPADDDGRYHFVVCGLDGDDAKEGTLRLLRSALNPHDYPMLYLTLSGRCIQLGPWHARKDTTAGSAKADRVLRAHGADAILWGEVPKQGDSLRFFLRGAGRQETETVLFDKGLLKERPDGAFATVLAAIALSQIAPLSKEKGHHLAFQMRPVAKRLQALLADSRLVLPSERGSLNHALGRTLEVIGEQIGDKAELECAIAAYRAALEDRSRDCVPLDWAATQYSLGNVLSKLGDWEGGTARLEEAIATYRAALEERRRDRVPLQWAATQNGLGIALSRLGTLDSGTARLNEAAAAYRAALEEYSRDRVPFEWAGIQLNLAHTLGEIGERESGTAQLKEAVAIYREALEETRRNRVPLDWAMTQNSLGSALLALGKRESETARLEEAIAVLRAALEERRRDWVPLQWAATQNNLGRALLALGRRESGTARRGWRKRSRPSARPWRSGAAIGCRSPGRRLRITLALHF
jgi:tetratricopeptide (TPR) repeat protein